MKKYIYKITNLINNKVYIGQTINFNRRCKQHKNLLLKENHTNKNLQADYNLFGITAFQFEIIDIVDKNQAEQIETYWINYYGGIESDNTYNITNLFTCNNQVKESISKANVGNIRTQDMKQKEASSKLKLYQTSAGVKIKQQISKSLKSYYNSDKGIKQRKKLSKQRKEANLTNLMKGKHLTEETKQKISKANKGKQAWNKNKKGLYKHSQSSKEKLRKASTKYSKNFINILREDYKELQSYKAVAKKHDMNPLCVSRLIRFGTTQCYKEKIKCND